MIRENYQKVLDSIEAARARRTSVPQEEPVRLIAVTKNHDAAAMREAIDAGASEVARSRSLTGRSPGILSAIFRPIRPDRRSGTLT